MPVVYAGIDDEWLAMCERRLGDRELTGFFIRQHVHERKLLADLTNAGLDLEALMGTRCAELLRAGLKLEIEGATNPAAYGEDFAGEVQRRLLRPIERRKGARQVAS